MLEKSCTEQDLCRVQHRFSRRQVREITKWGDTQLKIHLARLVELEYLLVHRGPHPLQSSVRSRITGRERRFWSAIAARTHARALCRLRTLADQKGPAILPGADG